ncbi:hypothetical protein [Umezawaea sp.]
MNRVERVSGRVGRSGYDVLPPRTGRGVACTQTTWAGAALDLVDP